ncbi:hypothetical protein GWN26_07505 [Candidatus Saccharibacteria bacterium]|nr:hypothetical protein [Calditrichia bacterium]NIV72098.1 hypothetical protein [Calditrichia bacterium]NIV98994.1 hypothetical protein [Candidatus Saccharibacteria bacterium]NIW79249.1 hypothetical protein [Calditrichia bacterium]
MTKKKKRLSKDAFDWVEDTSGKEEEASAKAGEKAEKSQQRKSKPAKTEKTAAESEAGQQKTLFVKYLKEDGSIVATQEVQTTKDKSGIQPWSEIPENMAVTAISLTGQFAGKTLLEIHTQYRVEVSGKKPKLVPIK